VECLGDGALVVAVDTSEEARGLAHAIRAWDDWPATGDVVVGYRSVTVVADPDAVDLAAFGDELSAMTGSAMAGSALAGSALAGSAMAGTGSGPGRTRRVVIPVHFDGPDLDAVAAAAKTSPAEVVAMLTATELTVAFLGFLPGFAYLDGLPPALADVARRASPRPVVPAGSVALAGGFAGIYPRPSPGGWQLVGSTGFALFDPLVEPFATLAPGDFVCFRADDDAGAPPVVGARPPLRSDAPRRVRVESPGLLSTVQDLGRSGVAHLGVPRAGAADPFSSQIANRLVGNDDRAAVLEVTATGPHLVFEAPGHVAVTGAAELTLDGRPLQPGAVAPVAAGQRVSVGRVLGDMRCYVAVAGGFTTPSVFGSRSSDVLTGMGPGALRAGDVLAIGEPARPRGRLLDATTHAGGFVTRGRRVLRVLPGPDAVGDDAVDHLCAVRWEVAAASDRMGVRLDGEPVPMSPEVTAGYASRGTVTGAVQVPPDGRPVVLLCDHATVGGYPVAATVILADLGVLGRCRPGDVVRFEPCDLDDAQRARRAAARALDRAVTGWYPARVD
jgi:KipI family sensor histidine kinase inhibitor